MTYKRYTVFIESELEVDIDVDHLSLVMSEEWQSKYWKFYSEDEAVAYLARTQYFMGPIEKRDGHANCGENLVVIDSEEIFTNVYTERDE